MTDPESRIQDVLAFWREAGHERWYTPDADFDAGVRERFLALWREAASGQLSSWETSDDGALALVIVLDQFPRNMFRGLCEAFSSDVLAREVAIRAIARGVDMRIEPPLLQFLYLPFMHSEELADQIRCVILFQAGDDPENLRYAEEHADIIRRFGRFPHRNRVLGRITTPEEQAFLDGGGFSG
ncbi:DUF924 family protein [Bradyrhizobium sp.]|uniref:DUF924 family protein n=1 Tax=Bradyrhizobium sp. TaxID=376 RepID=UPI002D670FD6|nr:DUF924 family protein [Bradyrhizobium sp.]HZR71388.1 DUF924 family protein [Bradyrhizobium sp.]